MNRTAIAWILSGVLFAGFPAAAENGVALSGMRIAVLRGEGSVNSVTSKANVVVPVVRIRTAAGLPAAGARVRFELIGTPARGLFAGQQPAIETETNARGEAAAPGYTPLRTGAFTLRVTAWKDSEQASAEIHQRNHSKPYAIDREHRIPKAVWVISGIAVGVAAGVLIKSAASGSNTPSATVNVGSPTVGGPR